MSRHTVLFNLSLAIISAGSAFAGHVSEYELKEDHNGYACFLSADTETEALTIQLSDYRDRWQMNFFLVA